MPWAKRVMQFQASALRPREESERHYLDVHSPWAVDTFAGMPEVVGYHTNRVLAQWDIRGGFGRVPDLWRYASMRYRPPGMEFSAEVGAMLAQDHQNFLRELRRFDVEESLVLDLGGQALSTAKFVLVLDRPDGLDRAAAVAAADALVAGLARAFGSAYGARRMTVDRVRLERENVAMREPGQQPTGVRFEDTPRLAFVELYLDHACWGEAFFADDDVTALLHGSPFMPAAVTAYHVEERAGHDRRPALADC